MYLYFKHLLPPVYKNFIIYKFKSYQNIFNNIIMNNNLGNNKKNTRIYFIFIKLAKKSQKKQGKSNLVVLILKGS
jgi:hypothetical protein